MLRLCAAYFLSVPSDRGLLVGCHPIRWNACKGGRYRCQNHCGRGSKIRNSIGRLSERHGPNPSPDAPRGMMFATVAYGQRFRSLTYFLVRHVTKRNDHGAMNGQILFDRRAYVSITSALWAGFHFPHFRQENTKNHLYPFGRGQTSNGRAVRHYAARRPLGRVRTRTRNLDMRSTD